jgi:hypothetical protein
MDLHHFGKLDLDPDPHQSEKQDPDPHQRQKQDPDWIKVNVQELWRLKI